MIAVAHLHRIAKMASMSNTVQHRRKAPYQSPYSKQVLSKSWNSSGFASATSSKQRFVTNSRTRTLEAQAPPPPEQPELFAEMESTQEALADALEKNAMQEAKCAELGKIEAEKEEEIAQLRGTQSVSTFYNFNDVLVAIAHETDATSKRLEEIAKLRENVSKQEGENVQNSII